MQIQPLLSNISNFDNITPLKSRIQTTFHLMYPVDFSIIYSKKFNTIKFSSLEKALIFHEKQEKECLKMNLPGIERLFLNCQAKDILLNNPELYIKDRKVGPHKPETLYPSSKKVTSHLKTEISLCNLYRLCIFCSTIQAFYLTLTCNFLTDYFLNKIFPLIAIYNLQIPNIVSFIKKLYTLSDTTNTIFSLFPEKTINTYSLFIMPDIPIDNDISITLNLEDYLINLTKTLKLPEPNSLPFELLRITFDMFELSLNLFLFLFAPIDLTKPTFHDINQILFAKVIFPENYLKNH